MSNHLAFATLTAVLQRELGIAVAADVTGARATTLRPDAGATLPSPGVNVFLLQTNPSGEMGAVDLPTRNAGGAVVNRPQGVYELVYLLTFHGDEATLEPQRVQASVLRRLHGGPNVTRAMIRDAVASANPELGLLGSDLADGPVSVKITPHRLSLDDLSKVWSVFFQTGYALSSAFKATYVILDAEAAGQASLPVKGRGIFGVTLGNPAIERTVPDRVAYAPNAPVALEGRGLASASVRFLVSGAAAALQGPATDAGATILLPAGVRAGVATVRAVDDLSFAPDDPRYPGHRTVESNAVPFLILPAVSTVVYQKDASPKRDSLLTVTPAMAVGIDQRVSLLLNRTDGATPPSYELAARPRSAEGDPLVFAARDVAAGTYLYRLRVDGIDSPLQADTTDPDPRKQPYVGPTVEVTA